MAPPPDSPEEPVGYAGEKPGPLELLGAAVVMAIFLGIWGLKALWEKVKE